MYNNSKWSNDNNSSRYEKNVYENWMREYVQVQIIQLISDKNSRKRKSGWNASKFNLCQLYPGRWAIELA